MACTHETYLRDFDNSAYGEVWGKEVEFRFLGVVMAGLLSRLWRLFKTAGQCQPIMMTSQFDMHMQEDQQVMCCMRMCPRGHAGKQYANR